MKDKEIKHQRINRLRYHISEKQQYYNKSGAHGRITEASSDKVDGRTAIPSKTEVKRIKLKISEERTGRNNQSSV